MSERQETSVTSISVLQKVAIKWAEEDEEEEKGEGTSRQKNKQRRRNVKMKHICPPKTVDNVQLSSSHAFFLLYGLQHVKHKADTNIKYSIRESQLPSQHWGKDVKQHTHTLHFSLTLICLRGEGRRETWKLVPLCLSWTSSALSYFKQNREADCIGD